jgi:hypothetical protein
MLFMLALILRGTGAKKECARVAGYFTARGMYPATPFPQRYSMSHRS